MGGSPWHRCGHDAGALPHSPPCVHVRPPLGWARWTALPRCVHPQRLGLPSPLQSAVFIRLTTLVPLDTFRSCFSNASVTSRHGNVLTETARSKDPLTLESREVRQCLSYLSGHSQLWAHPCAFRKTRPCLVVLAPRAVAALQSFGAEGTVAFLCSSFSEALSFLCIN